jgi:lipoate-protein ligase A
MVEEMWEVLDTGVASAAENMRIDAELLGSVESRSRPVLHFYEWERDSATYGYFIEPSKHLDLRGAEKRGLDLARRPTGGGIVFHVWDMAFSVLVPGDQRNTLANYAFVNDAVLRAVKEFLNAADLLELIPGDAEALDPHCGHFCMAKPTKYDVVLNGRKIAGAAQRKCKGGFLHQGTIALVMPPEDYLQDVLLQETRVAESMKAHTFALLGEKATEQTMKQAKRELRALLFKYLKESK